MHVCEGRGSERLGTPAGKGSEIAAGVEPAGSNRFSSGLSLTWSPTVPGGEGRDGAGATSTLPWCKPPSRDAAGMEGDVARVPGGPHCRAAPVLCSIGYWRAVLGLRPSMRSWCLRSTQGFREWGAEAVGSACPEAIGEGQAHPGTKSSGLPQGSSVAQWGRLVLCHLKPERPFAFLLLPSQSRSRTASGRDLTRKSPEAVAAARMGLQQ